MNFPKFKKKADLQHRTLVKLKPRRGTIYDAKGRILALDTSINSVYADARDVKDKDRVAVILSEILNLEKSLVADRLNRDKAFVWIKRKISSAEAERIERADIGGVALLKETNRAYPDENLFCHVIGFTDIDNNGLEGIEHYRHGFLTGKYGWKSSLRDARQNLISSHGEYLPAREGYSLILTLDEVIQHIVKSEVEDIVRTYKPKSIMIVVIEPKTGSVLAMVNYPDFNPNDYQHFDQEVFKNRSITDTFEPGSVFKIITASAVLEEGIVSTEDEFYCENGEYKVGKRILHDYRPYGDLTFREVIEKSSNIGTVKAAEKLGEDKLYLYIKKFGFGSKSGIDLFGEENGILRPKDTWSYVDMTTIPMGQGISGTALQLADAISVIANGGFLMRPFVVKYVKDNDGNIIREFKPHLIRRVISEEAALEMRQLLLGVIERGTGKRAKLKGYKACGKTGTAQKVDTNRRYAKDKYIASFIGFAPYEDPRVSLVVCVDEPKGKHFGGSVAAPAFKHIMEKILKYMEVKPSEKD